MTSKRQLRDEVSHWATQTWEAQAEIQRLRAEAVYWIAAREETQVRLEKWRDRAWVERDRANDLLMERDEALAAATELADERDEARKPPWIIELRNVPPDRRTFTHTIREQAENWPPKPLTWTAVAPDPLDQQRDADVDDTAVHRYGDLDERGHRHFESFTNIGDLCNCSCDQCGSTTCICPFGCTCPDHEAKA